MTALAEPVSQPIRALKSANAIRSKRAALKADVRSGETTVAAVLADIPQHAKSMRVFALLDAQHGWGDERVRHLLARLQIPSDLRLGKLTPRQVEGISERTQGIQPPPRARAPRPARVVISTKGLLHLLPRNGSTTACGSDFGARWRFQAKEDWTADRHRCRKCELSSDLVAE